jgi:thiamine phosphate synthase YjbQ (UPF0047 family)
MSTRPSLRLQLLGAAAGIAVSFGIYTFVTWEPVQNFAATVFPSGEAAVFTKEDKAERRNDIVKRAKEIIAEELAKQHEEEAEGAQ